MFDDDGTGLRRNGGIHELSGEATRQRFPGPAYRSNLTFSSYQYSDYPSFGRLTLVQALLVIVLRHIPAQNTATKCLPGSLQRDSSLPFPPSGTPRRKKHRYKGSTLMARCHKSPRRTHETLQSRQSNSLLARHHRKASARSHLTINSSVPNRTVPTKSPLPLRQVAPGGHE